MTGLVAMGRPLRIVHLCRIVWPHIGGMESVVGGLSTALADRGHEVSVVTLDRAITTGNVLPSGIYGGVRYHRVRRVGPRRYPAALGLVQRLRGADVVHVHGVDGLLHQAVATRPLHGARVGLTPHGGFLHTPRHRLLKAAWLRSGAAAAMRGCDAVWHTSAADAAALEPAGVDGQILQDGVDVGAFEVVRRAPEEGRWLVMGRVDVHKGLGDLFYRLAAVAQHDRRPFQVRVVGPQTDPDLVRQLKKLATKLGISHRVRFVGPVEPEALRGELARCEFALFPSEYEGFGVAVVEAMAAGVPVLVNRIPPFVELVQDGVDGFILEFAQGGAGRRIRQLRDGVQHVSDAARVSAARHGWSSRVLDWESAYSAVVGS